MQNDPTKWSKDLYRFILLVKFYYIEPTDLFLLQCLLLLLLQRIPQDLIHDLLEYLM
jgi:hypothetical protein